MALDDFFYTRILQYFDFQPTECQDSLFHKLAKFATMQGECDIMIVNGYAGTGKTSAVSAFVKTLKGFEQSFKLMAPTGRAAKVLANYTGEHASTIHKLIYRQKSMTDAIGTFQLNRNKSLDTIYIVDESSLITIDSPGSMFGTGDLLSDLVEFVRDGSNNKLILIGDDAQLPPISLDSSPALNADYMSGYGNVEYALLTTVVRQAKESGILYNATIIRKAIENDDLDDFPKLVIDGFNDVKRISGGDLIEQIGDSIEKYGLDETVILCRSNKRANRYNQGIRSTVLFREEAINRGDKVMIVKNCYQFEKMSEGQDELDFIANGDVAEIMKIGKYEERYGLHFAEATLNFPDYNNIEITAKVIMDTLLSESASLDSGKQKALFDGVFADYDNIPVKKKRFAAVREDPFFNALQIKYATAITCHKSQGGQWKSVFIDNSFWGDIISTDDLKWLYTAMTRAVERLYLVNFNKQFYE